MATLKFYVDDSGDSNDPKQQDLVLSVAGYLSDLDKWKRFEWLWNDVLEGYEVPYLHMKEWWDKDGLIYRDIKSYPEREAHFFGDLIQVIKDTTICAVSASVRLSDLREVNERRGLQLNAFSFGLYACILNLREKFPSDEIQIVIDKISKPHKHIQLAEDYAESDTYADLNVQALSITPLKAPDSFKNILPIQAADFLAWEVRKYGNDRLGWVQPMVQTKEEMQADYLKWAAENKPRRRRSAQHLDQAVPHLGHVWDKINIDAAHTVRHKNGWG